MPLVRVFAYLIQSPFLENNQEFNTKKNEFGHSFLKPVWSEYFVIHAEQRAILALSLGFASLHDKTGCISFSIFANFSQRSCLTISL